MARLIYNVNSRIARLASKRVRIVRDTTPREPWKDRDQVCVKTGLPEEVEDTSERCHWFRVNGVEFVITKDRLRKYFNEDPASWTKEAIQRLAEEDKATIVQYNDGDVFGLVLESWNGAERMWNNDDSIWGMYGDRELLDNLEDFAKDVDVVCCDKDCKDIFTITAEA